MAEVNKENKIVGFERTTAELDALVSKYSVENTATNEEKERAEIESEYVAIINDIISDPASTAFLRNPKGATTEFDTMEFGDTREIPLPPKKTRQATKTDTTTLETISEEEAHTQAFDAVFKKSELAELLRQTKEELVTNSYAVEEKEPAKNEKGSGRAKITPIRHYVQTTFEGVGEEFVSNEPRKFVVNIPDEELQSEVMDNHSGSLDEVTFDDLIAERNFDTMESREIGKMFRQKRLAERVLSVVREITEGSEDSRSDLDNEPDKAKTRKILEKRVARENIKQFFIGILGVILLVMGAAQVINLGIDPAGDVYKWVSLILFIVACGIGFEVFENAVRSAIRLKPNVDLIAAFFAILALVQSIVAMFSQTPLNTFLAFPVCVIFFSRYVALEKDKKTAADLKMLAFKPSKTCGGVIKSRSLRKEITGSADEKVSQIRNIAEINGDDFFTREYSKDGNEKIISILSWCSMLAAVVIFIVMLFVKKNGAEALTIATAAMSLLVPAGMAIVGSIAYTSFSKKLKYSGASIIGTKSMNEMADAKTLVLEDRHLFPVKALQITGVKQYGTYDNKELMISVVSTLKALRCPLSAVMYDMIDRREDLLVEPESVTYYDGRGIKAFVNGSFYAIGNRKMMEENDIALPTDRVAEKIVSNGKTPLYVASDGKLVAIFAIKYNESAAIKKCLHDLMQYGVSFAVKTRDPSLTPEFVAQKYDIPFGYLKLLPDAVAQREDEAADAETSPRIIAITKDPAVYLRAHTAAFRMKTAGRINKALLIAAFMMGALVTVITLTTGAVITPITALVVNLLWTAPILIINALLKKSV